ncbi:MAG: ATP-binding protein [Isosphaeraceae bacterium]
MQQFGMALVGAAAGLLAGLAVAVLLAYRGARASNEIIRGLTALGEGRSARPVITQVGGPVGRIALAYDAFAPRHESRMARLERDRQQLRAVLSGMAEGVVAVDSRRRLVFANPSADRLFGLGPSAVGRLMLELVRSPQIQTAVEASLTGPGPYQGEIKLPGRDPINRATARVLSVHGTPLPGSPPSGAVLVFHDVTELRRLERMRQDFVANASHELKTPLASIKAYTETLLDWALKDDSVNERFLRRIEEQAERLNMLILDLLSLARIESGELLYDHRPLALAPLVTRCVDAHRDRAESKGLSLLLDQSDLLPDTLVRADEEALRQILDNLIDNAVKYTATGGTVRLGCSTTREWVTLAVSDTGIGIPREDLPRIFERFYRVDKARSRELGGTGLGLSIVKHLVQSIGGQVEVTSRVGAGSTFRVQLPRASAVPTSPDGDAVSAAPSPQPGS